MGSNALDAISNGTTQGVKLAVNVGAMLLVFVALVYGVNYIIIHTLGDWTGLNTWTSNLTNGQFDAFSLEFILGAVFSPLAWVLGVPATDIMLVGQLLGEKTVLNEFYSYVSLTEMKRRFVFFRTLCHSLHLHSLWVCKYFEHWNSNWWYWSFSTEQEKRIKRIRYKSTYRRNGSLLIHCSIRWNDYLENERCYRQSNYRSRSRDRCHGLQHCSHH